MEKEICRNELSETGDAELQCKAQNESDDFGEGKVRKKRNIIWLPTIKTQEEKKQEEVECVTDKYGIVREII